MAMSSGQKLVCQEGEATGARGFFFGSTCKTAWRPKRGKITPFRKGGHVSATRAKGINLWGDIDYERKILAKNAGKTGRFKKMKFPWGGEFGGGGGGAVT